jgi:hypothetical protein
MEHFPPTHYYLQDGGIYQLRERGTVHVDYEANRHNPELIRLKTDEGKVTSLIGKWVEANQRYEYVVVEGLSENAEETKPMVELMRSYFERYKNRE